MTKQIRASTSWLNLTAISGCKQLYIKRLTKTPVYVNTSVDTPDDIGDVLPRTAWLLVGDGSSNVWVKTRKGDSDIEYSTTPIAEEYRKLASESAPSPAFKTGRRSFAMRVVNGKLHDDNGPVYRVGICAYDLLMDAIAGGYNWQSQLQDIRNRGITLIRTSITPVTSKATMSSMWVNVGTDPRAPVPTFIPRVTEFLDHCWRLGIAVELVLLWQAVFIHTVLGVDRTQWANKDSVLRTYFREFSKTIVSKLKYHPAIALWAIGNEWDVMAQSRQLMRVDGTTTTVYTTNTPITAVTNSAGLVSVKSVGHMLVSGQTVNIYDVGGVASANGYKTITVVDADNFTINGSVFSGSYTSGGFVEDASEQVYLETVNDIYAAIRGLDARPVVAPTGFEGWSANTSRAGRDYQSYFNSVLNRVGDCEVFAFHYYPDYQSHDGVIQPRTPFVGCETDVAGGWALTHGLAMEARARNKVFIVEEVCGNWDYPVNTITNTQYRDSVDAGAQLLLDWGWFSSNDANISNLRTLRAGAIPVLLEYEKSMGGEVTRANPMYRAAEARRELILSGDGGVKIPLTPAMQPTTSKGMFVAAYITMNEVLSSGFKKIISCALSSTQMGWWLGSTWYQSDNVLAMGVTCNSVNSTMVEATLPRLDRFVRRHYAFYYDPVSGRMDCWVDGLYCSRGTFTANSYTPLVGYSDLVVGGDLTGGNLRKMQIGQLVFGNQKPTTREVLELVTEGKMPSWIKHRYEMSGDLKDVVGGNHATSFGNISWT